MELWPVDIGAWLWSTSTPLHTPENSFIPINPEGGFSSIEDTEEHALDVSDISNMPCLEFGAAATRSQSPTRKSAKGVKMVVAKQRPSVNSLEKRFALLSLRPLASLSSLDFGDCGKFSSPSSKALSEDLTWARAGSYHLSSDSVTSAYDL